MQPTRKALYNIIGIEHQYQVTLHRDTWRKVLFVCLCESYGRHTSFVPSLEKFPKPATFCGRVRTLIINWGSQDNARTTKRLPNYNLCAKTPQFSRIWASHNSGPFRFRSHLIAIWTFSLLSSRDLAFSKVISNTTVLAMMCCLLLLEMHWKDFA